MEAVNCSAVGAALANVEKYSCRYCISSFYASFFCTCNLIVHCSDCNALKLVHRTMRVKIKHLKLEPHYEKRCQDVINAQETSTGPSLLGNFYPCQFLRSSLSMEQSPDPS